MVEGKGLLVYSTNGEQRLFFRTLGHDWTPVDFDGVTLMRRREDRFDQVGQAWTPADASHGEAPSRPRTPPTTAFTAAEIKRRRDGRRKFRSK